MTALQFDVRACPVCGSTDESNVVADATFEPGSLEAISFASRKLPEYLHHRIVCCPTCDLAYASPAPNAKDIEHAYESAAFVSDSESRFAAETYRRLVSSLALPRLSERDSALDVGASDGAFMRTLLELGFDDVRGVEPSLPSIEAAGDDVRSSIVAGGFSASLFPDGRFGLITVLQTLEHVDDPLQVVRDVRALLRDGGALLVVVHDRRTLPARLLGLRSPIYDVEHLQLFSRKSITFLLESAGFVDCRVESVRNRYPVSYWLKIAPLPAGLKRRVLTFLERTGLGRLPISVSPGNIAAVGWAPGTEAAASA